MKKEGQRNYAFIDGQNLYLAIEELGWRLDYARFRRYLMDRFSVTKAFIFIGFLPENEGLYVYLRRVGYTVIFKPTLKIPNGKVKGNVDAELVLHAMAEYQKYDKAVIISGDGDFYCLVEYLEKNQKILRLIVPNKYKYSSLLRRFMPFISFLNATGEKLGRH